MLCIFEDDQVAHLNPLAHTRAVYDLRLGIRTLRETLAEAFGSPRTVLHCRAHVAGVTAQEHDALVNHIPGTLGVLCVNGRYVPEDGDLLDRLRRAMDTGEPARAFVQGDALVAAWLPEATTDLVQAEAITRATFGDVPEEAVDGATFIDRLWDLRDALTPALLRDFAARTKGYQIYERPGADVQDGARLVAGARVYVAPGATIRPGAILNASSGPIYIDEHALVMEGAVVRGPAYVGPHAQVKVHGDVEEVAIGPWCKVGGEVHGSTFHSFSSKGHAGYVGDSYLGRWCNLGADTNTSNLRNDYSPVPLYSEVTEQFEASGRQFLGLFMGDHSKCGINTMFNTGTVIGVACNLYGAGYLPRYVPSFAWGSPEARFVTYRLPKALAVAARVMARRATDLTEADEAMLTAVFDQTAAAREAFFALKRKP